jgi:hypothetical protein
MALGAAPNASFWAIGKAVRSWESDRSVVVDNGGWFQIAVLVSGSKNCVPLALMAKVQRSPG